MSNVNPGDVELKKVSLITDKGYINFPLINILNASVYENMMSLGVYVKFSVSDMAGILENVNMRTGEVKGIFSFSVPGSEERKYEDLRLESIKKVQDIGYSGSKVYEVTLYSKHLFKNISKNIMGAYENSVGDIVKKIAKEIGIEKWKEFENTKGNQKFLAQNFKADYLLHDLTLRAVSQQNPSSLYFLFENKEGHNFTTLETLFKQQPLRKMVRENARGSNTKYNTMKEGQIINYVYPKSTSLSHMIMGARKQEIRESSPGNHLNNSKTYNKKDTDFTSGGKSSFLGSIQETYGKDIGHAQTIPSDPAYLPRNYLTQYAQNKQSYLSYITDNCLNIQTHGDTAYTPGKILDVNLPTNDGTTGPRKFDQQMNGKMVIVGVRHEIRGNRTSPRYICHLDLLKGSHSG